MAKFKFPGNIGNQQWVQSGAEREFNKLMGEKEVAENRKKWETVMLMNAAIFKSIEGLAQYKDVLSPEAYEAASERLLGLRRQGGVEVLRISKKIESLTGAAPELVAFEEDTIAEKTKQVLEFVTATAAKEFPKR